MENSQFDNQFIHDVQAALEAMAAEIEKEGKE